MVKITKLSGLENKDLKVVQAPPRIAPHTFPNKPFLGTIVGSRGSGKTNCMINLIQHYDKYKFFDKVYMFSPTSFGNDPKYQLLEDNKHHFVYQKYPTYTDDIFKEVLDEIKSDIDEYKEWEKKYKIYKKFMKYGYKRLTPEEVLEVEMMMVDEDCSSIGGAKGDAYTIEEPECQWKQMPTSLLIFNDLVSNTELYKTTARGIFYNFVILHRHLLSSLLFCVQTWSGAVPRQIRGNLSLAILFNLKPEIKKQVADEMCADMSEETFIEMWNTSCVNQWDFFMINYDAPKHLRFRKNFDSLFVLE
jgi:hypothetical protein